MFTICIMMVPVISAIIGYYRGFIRKLIGIAAWILIFFLVRELAPILTQALLGSTVHGYISERVANSDAEAMKMLAVLGLNTAVADAVATKLVSMLGFLITLIGTSIIVHGICFALRLAEHLPLIKGINRLAGGIAGAAEGLLLIWIFFIAIVIGVGTKWGFLALAAVADSNILSLLFAYNPLLLFVL